MKQKYLNLLGLAMRAGKCSLGIDKIIKDIQHKRAKLIVIAKDCSSNTKKKLTDKCHTYQIPFVVIANKDILSHAIGQKNRVAIAILDQGFAAKIKSLVS